MKLLMALLMGATATQVSAQGILRRTISSAVAPQVRQPAVRTLSGGTDSLVTLLVVDSSSGAALGLQCSATPLRELTWGVSFLEHLQFHSPSTGLSNTGVVQGFARLYGQANWEATAFAVERVGSMNVYKWWFQAKKMDQVSAGLYNWRAPVDSVLASLGVGRVLEIRLPGSQAQEVQIVWSNTDSVYEAHVVKMKERCAQFFVAQP